VIKQETVPTTRVSKLATVNPAAASNGFEEGFPIARVDAYLFISGELEREE